MNPNYAYQVRSYSDLVDGTGLTVTQFVAANPNTWAMQNGPDGLPNLITESATQPGPKDFQDATTLQIYTEPARHYIGGQPPHR